MILTLITLANIFFASMLILLWIVERKKSSQKKACIQADENSGDCDIEERQFNKKIEYLAITKKLFEIGELKKNKSGYWIWSKSGEHLGAKILKNKWNLQ